ncbi:MAG: hypothetical protein B6I20_05410 [Bacteroidetes bacterium 4572_117]|nr:MAG: hypothetical protein B6I20_05410 [Bacteroidetes bacterium 4572_117]
MRVLIIFSALFLISGVSLTAQNGSVVDTRDGKTYKTIQIGQQIWMAENLDYNIEKSYCFAKKTENCEKYGRLYRWEAASKACPEGWHLPSDDEGGYRNPPSNYFLMGMQAFFWTATDNSSHAWYRQMRDGSGHIFRRTRPKSWGMSVRCVKN